LTYTLAATFRMSEANGREWTDIYYPPSEENAREVICRIVDLDLRIGHLETH
jgi:hypothetical protein